MTTFQNTDQARSWIRSERQRRGWSTIRLADAARRIAQREGSGMRLTQQTISAFEQPGGTKRMPEWLRYVRMAFEEGEQPAGHEVAARDELVYVRQVDIRYAMGDGAELAEYPDTQLIPFNLNSVRAMTRAPLERLFIAEGIGESMEPTLLRHDRIMIDASQTRVAEQDKLWAITYADAGMIKRLRRVKTPEFEGYLILSDNPLVPPQQAAYADVQIVGKVVWVSRRFD